MPSDYCGPCGYIYQTPVNANCLSGKSLPSRRTTQSSIKMETEKVIKVESDAAAKRAVAPLVGVDEDWLSDEEQTISQQVAALEKRKQVVLLAAKTRALETELSLFSLKEKTKKMEERDEQRCIYGHWYSHCGDKTHKRAKCSKE